MFSLVTLIMSTFATIAPFFMTLFAIGRLYCLHKHRNTLFVKHRDYHLTSYLVATHCTALIVIAPTMLLSALHVTSNISHLILLTIAQSAFYAYLNLFVVRLWLLYYQIKKLNVENDRQWMSFISDTYESIESRWVFQYQKYLGNKKSLTNIFFFMGIAFGIGQTILTRMLRSSVGEILAITLSVIVVFCILSLVCLTPTFDDAWGLRRDSRFLMGVLFIQMILLVPLAVGSLFVDVSVDETLVIISLVWIANLLPSGAILWRLTETSLPKQSNSCCWNKQPDEVTKMIRMFSSDFNEEVYQQRQNDDISDYHHRISSPSLSSHCKSQLLMTLADDAKFYDFADHLVKEFCLESVLYLVEVTQFQNEMIKDCDDETREQLEILKLAHMTLAFDRRRSSLFLNASLKRQIPPSSIVYDDSLTDAAKARALFNKYIATTAVFELNLSAPCRTRMENVFNRMMVDDDGDGSDSQDLELDVERMGKLELFRVFDPVTKEILKLVMDAHGRFQSNLCG